MIDVEKRKRRDRFIETPADGKIMMEKIEI